MAKKKTYMIAVSVQVVLYPTIYIEVVADNAADALKKAKKDDKDVLENYRESFLDEIKTDLNGLDLTGKARFVGCGRADQYHSSAECKLCRVTEKG